MGVTIFPSPILTPSLLLIRPLPRPPIVSGSPAHASAEGHGHQLPAGAHHPAGGDHLLQDPGHLCDPQGVLRRPVPPHPAVGREGHRGTPLPEAGEGSSPCVCVSVCVATAVCPSVFFVFFGLEDSYRGGLEAYRWG